MAICGPGYVPGDCLLVGDERRGVDTVHRAIFSLYRLYLATVGIWEMHATTGKALPVVLLPAILVLVLVVGASAVVFFRAG